MKLYINDNGDPSVGVRAQQWAIECPFEKGDMEPADLEHFPKKGISRILLGFSPILSNDFILEAREIVF